MREIRSDERAVGVVQREHDGTAGGIAERTGVQVRHVPGRAGIARRVEDDRGPAGDLDLEVAGVGRPRSQRQRQERQLETDPHRPEPLAGQ